MDINQYRDINAKKLINKHNKNQKMSPDFHPRIGVSNNDFLREQLKNIKWNQKEEKGDKDMSAMSTSRGRLKKNKAELLAEQIKAQREAIAKAEKREALKQRMVNFTETLKSKLVVINDQVNQGNFQKECLADPTKALNYEEDVIDPNLDLLLHNPEVYNKVEIGEKKR